MTVFDEATALEPIPMQPVGDGSTGPDRVRHFAWQVPAGWEQGRGAWGGLVVGAFLRAVHLAQADQPRPLRTISAHLMGSVPAGAAIIEVRPARLGSAMSTWAATVRADSGEALAEAMVICGTSRADDLGHLLQAGQAQAPKTPDWRDCPPFPIAPPLGPDFAAHLEFRPLQGIPMSGSSAQVLGWIRLPDVHQWTDVTVLSIVDAYWPSMFPTLSEPRPMATVSFSAHLLVDPTTLPTGEPLLLQGSMSAALDGFTTETRRLWSADGRLVVENLQSIVVIR